MALRKLLVTSDISLIQSLRMALDSEGIAAIIANEAMAPIQPITVHVTEEDFDTALALLNDLQDTPSGAARQPLTAGRRSWVGITFALLMLAALCAQLL